VNTATIEKCEKPGPLLRRKEPAVRYDEAEAIEKRVAADLRSLIGDLGIMR
jgi:hypothetical protein